MTHQNRITAAHIATCATPANDNDDLDCAAGILTALLISAVLWTLAGLLVWGLS